MVRSYPFGGYQSSCVRSTKILSFLVVGEPLVEENMKSLNARSVMVIALAVLILVEIDITFDHDRARDDFYQCGV